MENNFDLTQSPKGGTNLSCHHGLLQRRCFPNGVPQPPQNKWPASHCHSSPWRTWLCPSAGNRWYHPAECLARSHTSGTAGRSKVSYSAPFPWIENAPCQACLSQKTAAIAYKMPKIWKRTKIGSTSKCHNWLYGNIPCTEDWPVGSSGCRWAVFLLLLCKRTECIHGSSTITRHNKPQQHILHAKHEICCVQCISIICYVSATAECWTQPTWTRYALNKQYMITQWNKFSTWTYTVCTNLMMKTLRKKKHTTRCT